LIWLYLDLALLRLLLRLLHPLELPALRVLQLPVLQLIRFSQMLELL
jgi:hypothetical protein